MEILGLLAAIFVCFILTCYFLTECTVCSASDERIRIDRVVVARTPQYPVSACGLRRWKYEPSGSKHFTQ